MAHIVWYSENMEFICDVYFIKRLKQGKNMKFGADPHIYLDKKLWNSDTCNVNQWDLYNSIADAYLKWYKHQLSLYISNNIS